VGASAAANAAEAVDADDDSGEDSEDGTLLSGSRGGLVGMHLFDQFQQTSAGPPGPNLARPEPRARRRATLPRSSTGRSTWARSPCMTGCGCSGRSVHRLPVWCLHPPGAAAVARLRAPADAQGQSAAAYSTGQSVGTSVDVGWRTGRAWRHGRPRRAAVRVGLREQMALRWCAAGMVEAGKQFRRVNGHMHLRTLRDTREKVTQPAAAATENTEAVTGA
jgi:hypothetical protein